MQDALAPLFSQLLEVAGALLVAAAEPAISAGCELYVLLMTVFRSDRSLQVSISARCSPP